MDDKNIDDLLRDDVVLEASEGAHSRVLNQAAEELQQCKRQRRILRKLMVVSAIGFLLALLAQADDHYRGTRLANLAGNGSHAYVLQNDSIIGRYFRLVPSVKLTKAADPLLSSVLEDPADAPCTD